MRTRTTAKMPWALALLTCSISLATSCTRVDLIEQTNRATCSPGTSYGCAGNGSMYTINCRGRFRCGALMPIIRCGYPAGAKRHSCFCNGTSPTSPTPIRSARSRVCSTQLSSDSLSSLPKPAQVIVHIHYPNTAGTLVRKVFGCAGWQCASSFYVQPLERSFDQCARAYCRSPADLQRVVRVQLLEHMRRGSTPHLFIENHCSPSIDVPLAIEDVLLGSQLLGVRLLSFIVLRHPVSLVESNFAHFRGDVQHLDPRYPGVTLPKYHYLRVAVETLLFSQLGLPLQEYSAFGGARTVGLQDDKYDGLGQNLTLSLLERNPKAFRTSGHAAALAEDLSRRLRSIESATQRGCDALVAAGLGRLQRLTHVFIMEDPRTVQEIARLSLLDARLTVPAALGGTGQQAVRTNSVHSSQYRPPFANTSQHVCSIALYEHVASLVRARSNFTLR